MQKLRMGVIGCGGMTVNGGHVAGFRELEDTVEVTSVCDIVPERAQEAGKLLNVGHVTTDWKEMVDHVDAVLISLPHDLHYECGMFFANAKKHIMMEKPLCNSESECEDLIQTAKQNNVTLMCAYPVRFWPEIIKLKEMVDSGEYGKIIQMSIWTEQLTHFSDPYHWANTARIGGGQFFSHGCHYIDILLWFLGEPVKGIHMGSRVGTEWMREEGTSNAVIKFESGAMGYHFGTWGARGTKHGNDFQILCEKAMLEYDRNTEQVLVHVGRTEELLDSEYSGKTKAKLEVVMDGAGRKPGLKRSENEIGHFVDCVRTGKKPLTNADDALQGLRVIWKLYDAEKHDIIADLRGLGLDKN